MKDENPIPLNHLDKVWEEEERIRKLKEEEAKKISEEEAFCKA